MRGRSMTEAAFFDRDGTLCHNDEREERFRDECISRWAGHAFELPYDKFISAFNALGARYPSLRGADTPERERDFFYEWYRVILTGEGICEGVDEKAALLTSRLWVQAKVLYPDTLRTLDYFRAQGVRMGVISDTGRTLEHTLRALGIDGYFGSVTSSAAVGVGKPDPRIYRAALEALGAQAVRSMYVDDCGEEALGARKLGFTAFLIDRAGGSGDEWTIDSLWRMAEYHARGQRREL